MSDNGAVISAKGVTKVFKDFWGRPKVRAVDEMDLEVHRGEVFGLLGPNGSGKSTTVKMLLGLLYPTRGRLSVFGESPRVVKIKARIGYLPEESYLYRYLDSNETLDFFGRLFDLEGPTRTERIEQLLDMVGLTQARRRRVGEFSKGMSRRIGIAQALINDPDLIILDEPTSGLDPLGCREVKELIQNLSRRGKTVLLSSHLLSDVEDVCDRVAILYNRHIQAQGPIKELLARPDVFRVTAPVMERDRMERLLEEMRQEVGRDAVRVDTPTRSLESFFLEVVERARAAQPDSSGAAAGGPVANYLAASGDAQPAESILDRLAQAPAAEPTEPTTEPAPGEAAAPVEPQLDSQRLAALVTSAEKPGEPEQQPAESAAESATKAEEQADTQLLQGLLAGKNDASAKGQDEER